MKHPVSKRSLVASVLILILSAVSIQMPAYGAMMTTQDIVSESQVEADRAVLQQRLMRDDVKTQLLALGVNPETVEQRIDSLSHSELAQINDKLDSLPAGGDGLGTVAVVLLILILLEITGAIDIFPRI